MTSVVEFFMSGEPAAIVAGVAIVLVSLLINFVWEGHKLAKQCADYDYVLQNNVFENAGEKFLNMGLWTKLNLDELHGDTDKILDAIEVEIERELKNPKCADENNFKDSQTKMYEIIFACSNLRRKNIRGIETGPGTGAHYLLWDKWGLQATMDQFEPFLSPAKQLTDAVPALMDYTTPQEERVPGLQGTKRYVLGSDDVGETGEKFEAIMANESAFHYPDRAAYFKRCCKALKPGGTLVMTDLVASDEMKGSCMTYWFWKYYMRYVLGFPPSTAYVTFDKYKHNLESAGFSDVRVVDISRLAVGPFYQNMREIVKIPEDASIWLKPLWLCNDLVTARLFSRDATKAPMKYTLVVCKK